MAKIETFAPKMSSINTLIDRHGNLYVMTWRIVPGVANVLEGSVCGTAFPFPEAVA